MLLMSDTGRAVSLLFIFILSLSSVYALFDKNIMIISSNMSGSAPPSNLSINETDPIFVANNISIWRAINTSFSQNQTIQQPIYGSINLTQYTGSTAPYIWGYKNPTGFSSHSLRIETPTGGQVIAFRLPTWSTSSTSWITVQSNAPTLGLHSNKIIRFTNYAASIEYGSIGITNDSDITLTLKDDNKFGIAYDMGSITPFFVAQANRQFIGIGTTKPAARLHVTSSIATLSTSEYVVSGSYTTNFKPLEPYSVYTELLDQYDNVEGASDDGSGNLLSEVDSRVVGSVNYTTGYVVITDFEYNIIETIYYDYFLYYDAALFDGRVTINNTLNISTLELKNGLSVTPIRNSIEYLNDSVYVTNRAGSRNILITNATTHALNTTLTRDIGRTYTLNNNHIVTSNTTYVSVFNISTLANANNTVICTLLTNTSGTTNALTVNVTYINSTRRFTAVDYYTSTTAKNGCATDSISAICTNTSSAGIDPRMHTIFIDSTGTTPGMIQIYTRTVTGTAAQVFRAGNCVHKTY